MKATINWFKGWWEISPGISTYIICLIAMMILGVDSIFGLSLAVGAGVYNGLHARRQAKRKGGDGESGTDDS